MFFFNRHKSACTYIFAVQNVFTGVEYIMYILCLWYLTIVKVRLLCILYIIGDLSNKIKTKMENLTGRQVPFYISFFYNFVSFFLSAAFSFKVSLHFPFLGIYEWNLYKNNESTLLEDICTFFDDNDEIMK